MSTNKSTLAKAIMKKLTAPDKYELEADVVQDMEKVLVEVLTPYYIYDASPNAKPSKAKATKAAKAAADASATTGETVAAPAAKATATPRKSSAYNQYVKTNMKLLTCPQKEKMVQLGASWKVLDEEGRKVYAALAEAANNATA